MIRSTLHQFSDTLPCRLRKRDTSDAVFDDGVTNPTAFMCSPIQAIEHFPLQASWGQALARLEFEADSHSFSTAVVFRVI